MIESNTKIDITEKNKRKYEHVLLKILLKDKTTQKNIVWGSNDYLALGSSYECDKEIKLELIKTEENQIIQPRNLKKLSHQDDRRKNKAEVFTPSWLCNEQNNLVDEQWFGRKGVFNNQLLYSWETNFEKIEFPKDKKLTWEKYVDARRIEVSCGEAPYLVSRYDTVTGEEIPLMSRIGILDRKMRVVNENTENEEDWFEWTQRAFQSVYGYEFQGDSLFLARKNLLDTFIDNMIYKFNKVPSLKQLKSISNIISWNLWQMDGITFAIPYGISRENKQLDFFNDKEDELKVQYCKIRNWRSKKTINYAYLMGEIR